MPNVIARSAHGKPCLEHYTEDFVRTLCGVPLKGWSCAYPDMVIPEVACKRACRVAFAEQAKPLRSKIRTRVEPERVGRPIRPRTRVAQTREPAVA